MPRKLTIEDASTPEILAKIEEWAVNGLNNEQIAKNLGVAKSTFYRWKDQSREISDALKKGKQVSDDEVENALFKRAIGFKMTEDEYEMVDMSQEEYDEHVGVLLDAWKQDNPDWTAAQRDKYVASIPRTKRIHTKSKVKDVAPDTIAAIFWLKNRRPAEWRDKRAIEMSGNVGANKSIDLSGISTEDLKKYTETLEKAIKEGEGNDGD